MKTSKSKFIKFEYDDHFDPIEIRRLEDVAFNELTRYQSIYTDYYTMEINNTLLCETLINDHMAHREIAFEVAYVVASYYEKLLQNMMHVLS